MRSCGVPTASTVAEPVIPVSVAYAERDRQTVLKLQVPAGTSASEAVERSGIRGIHPRIPPDATLGIFGEVVRGERVLAAGDRVELYRKLPADPKETRRALARRGETMGSRRR